LPLINIFFHASESALSHSFVSEMGDDLYMFNKTILDGSPDTPNIEIDDGSPENLKKLRRFAEDIMEENADQLDHICDILVRNYERKQGKSHKQPQKDNWVRRLFPFGKRR